MFLEVYSKQASWTLLLLLMEPIPIEIITMERVVEYMLSAYNYAF